VLATLDTPARSGPKRKPLLPLIALALDALAVLGFFLPRFTTIFVLAMSIAGLILGIIALAIGRLDTAGKVQAIVAIALPGVAMLFVMAIFTGIITGLFR
jgi:hypothetical protein